MLAEDNEMNQKLLSILLKQMGCDVTIVNNGMEAIIALKKENYDIILMDLQMPIMDGYSATKYIRKEMQSTIPIIGVSADVFEESKTKSMEVGMNGHIGKPIKSRELFILMKKVLTVNKDTTFVQ